MNLRSTARLLGKLALLTIYFTICFIIGTVLSGLADANPDPESAGGDTTFLWLLANSAVTVGLLAWFSLRSKWPRWKSTVVLFVFLFAVGSLLPQLDALFFSDSLEVSGQEVRTIILAGAIGAALYIPVSVWWLRRNYSYPLREADPVLVSIPYQKMGLLSVTYVIVYFLFGYFVAWQSADLREFYSGSRDILPFGEHLASTWSTSPGLFLLQLIRGAIWTSLAYLAGRMFSGSAWEKVLAISLSFSLIGAFLLLLPNPYIPETVRKVHFIEVTTSNFLFGLLAAYLLFVQVNTGKSQPQNTLDLSGKKSG